MNEEKLRDYLDNLNLSIYSESELWKIYKAICIAIDEIDNK